MWRPHYIPCVCADTLLRTKRWLARPCTGMLADLLSSKAAAAGSPAALPEERVRGLMQQLLTAVDYCHRLGIALYNMRVRGLAPLRCSPECEHAASNPLAGLPPCSRCAPP